MFTYIIRRFLWAGPVLLVLTFVIFALMRVIPGGPFDFAGDKSLPVTVVQNLERRYHLDWPLGWQFSSYVLGDDLTQAVCQGLAPLPGCQRVRQTAAAGLSRGLIRGDLGISMKQRGRAVNDLVKESFPISFQLGLISMGVALLIGLPVGIFAALKHNSWLDYGSSFVAIVGVSLPNLVLGPLLIWLFPLTLGWFEIATWGAKPPFLLGLFPTSLDWGFWAHAALPALTLGTSASAAIARLTRASLLQIVHQEYIRTARAKGLREQRVIVGHALRNGLIPVVTMIGPLLVMLVTGTFIVEQIFGIPGMGKHFVTSITNRDYPVITGVSLIFGALLIFANLAVDLTYVWLDPRIKYK